VDEDDARKSNTHKYRRSAEKSRDTTLYDEKYDVRYGDRGRQIGKIRVTAHSTLMSWRRSVTNLKLSLRALVTTSYVTCCKMFRRNFKTVLAYGRVSRSQ